MPSVVRRFVLVLQTNGKKLLLWLGVSSLADIIKEFIRGKLMDQMYTNLGGGLGRWLVAYPAAFFTLALCVVLVVVVVATIRESAVAKSSVICDERGVPYQRQPVSPRWIYGLGAVALICICIISYGTYRYYQISVGHFKVSAGTNIILPVLPLEPPAPVPPNPPSLLDVFNDDFPNLLRARNDISIEGTNTSFEQQVYLDFLGKSKFIGFYIPRSSNPIAGGNTANLCSMLIDQVPSGLAQLSKNVWLQGGYGPQTNTLDELTFTGRVLIYHEDLLSIPQQADIINAYKLKNLDVQFRGEDYLMGQIILWRQKRDLKQSH